MRAAIPVLAAVSAAALLCGCGGGDAPPLAQLPSPAPIATTTSAAPVATTDPPIESASDAPTESAPATVGVPDVVGMRLPDATEQLKTAGYPKVSHVDATGQGRHVIAAGDWVVRSQVPAAGMALAPGTPVTLRVGKPTDSAGSRTVRAGVVPDVVCAELNQAKDALKQAGFTQLSTQDATGQGRHQILDRSWLVVSQSVKAGSRPDKLTGIVLGVVKYGEPTGASGCQS